MSAPAYTTGHGSPWTPGPWDYERHLDPGDLPRAWVGRLSEQRFAALSCGENRAEADANARLIAAAPDMFEALTKVRAILDTHRSPGADDPLEDPCELVNDLVKDEIHELVTAVLAKASMEIE